MSGGQDFGQKRSRLLEALKEYRGMDLAVAFSGGVDSSLLLKLACEGAGTSGRKVWAVTVKSELQPEQDMRLAAEEAKGSEAEHVVLKICVLENDGIRNNSKDRCYLCKRLMFAHIRAFAEKKGTSVVLEGTNADDLHVFRPGIRALRELGIRSPFAEAGFGKEDVRKLAAEYGLSAAERPSAPCLATRFPYGAELTQESLHMAEQGEAFLHDQGFQTVRLRVHGRLARVEVPAGELTRLLDCRREVTEYLHELGYRRVTADLEGFRSGSMDEAENEEE